MNENVKPYCEVVRGHHEFLYYSERLYERKEGIWRPVQDHEIESYLVAAIRESYFDKALMQSFMDSNLTKSVKAEFIDNIKSSSFMTAEDVKRHDYPFMIAFKNCYIDIDRFKTTGELKMGDLAFVLGAEFAGYAEQSFFFQQIPHNINEEMLAEITSKNMTSSEILFNYAPHIYNFLDSLVGFERINTQVAKIGYCFYRANPYKLMFMELGDKDSGKTTFIRLLKYVIGSENISLVSLQDLANYQFAAARLFGKLLNLYDDLPTTFIKQTGMLKMLSGESPVGAQRKFKDPIEFDNYAKLMFVTNKLPSLKEMADEAFFSRWIITEYNEQFKRDDRFFANLIADEKEIEALIIAAFYSLSGLLNVGYEFMQGTKNYTELWKCQTNSIYDFMLTFDKAGKIKYGIEFFVPKDDLYSLYTSFTVDERDDTPEKKTSFTQELERMFHITAARMKVEGRMLQVYKGVKIASKEEPQEQLDNYSDVDG